METVATLAVPDHAWVVFKVVINVHMHLSSTLEGSDGKTIRYVVEVTEVASTKKLKRISDTLFLSY